MILDKTFKTLHHKFNGYKKFSNGQQIEPGYKPDFVLKQNNNYVILESENSTSRKLHVGCMLKAAHFLQNEKKGILVIVMSEKSNTKVSSITKQLEIYFSWIKDKTNLRKIYVIDEKKYYPNKAVLPIEEKEFLNKAFIVQ